MPPEEKGFVLGFVMISRQSSALAVVVVGLVVLLLLLVVVVKFKALMSAWLIVVVVGSSAFARAKSAHKAKKLTKANADHCKRGRKYTKTLVLHWRPCTETQERGHQRGFGRHASLTKRLHGSWCWR